MFCNQWKQDEENDSNTRKFNACYDRLIIEEGCDHVGGILLFDGVCSLCNHLVDFVMKRDKEKYYQFASLQSEKGQSLLKEYQLEVDLNTMVVIENDKAYVKSDAVLKVAPKLTGGWFILGAGKWVPRLIRHKLYDVVAANRYRLFGKKTTCRLPTEEERSRFLT